LRRHRKLTDVLATGGGIAWNAKMHGKRGKEALPHPSLNTRNSLLQPCMIGEQFIVATMYDICSDKLLVFSVFWRSMHALVLDGVAVTKRTAAIY
jgi:hypothetical protein